jgi:hypothetical protein
VKAAGTRGYNRIVQHLVQGSKVLYARPKTVGVPGAKPPGLQFASAKPTLGGNAADKSPIVLSGPPHKIRGRVSGEVAGVGEIINVDRTKTPAILEIHRYIGVWKGVGVQWYPSYRQNDGRETTAVTGQRYVELVPANKLIDHGRLNAAGNLIHGLVAKLSARKWEVDCVSPSPQESFPVNVAQHLYYREGLEQLMRKIAAIDGVLELGFHYSVLYAEDVFVDYLEVFTGKGRLRAEVMRRDLSAGPLVDKSAFIGESDYELKTVPLGTKEWHLETHGGGVALIELHYVIRPKTTYVAWPCGSWSMQRERNCDPLTEDNDLGLWEENVALLRLSAKICLFQTECACHAVGENPPGSRSWQKDVLTDVFGTPEAPRVIRIDAKIREPEKWVFAHWHCCQLDLKHPEMPAPFKKPMRAVASFPEISHMDQFRCTDIGDCANGHAKIEGCFADGTKMSAFTGNYTKRMGRELSLPIAQVIKRTKRRASIPTRQKTMTLHLWPDEIRRKDGRRTPFIPCEDFLAVTFLRTLPSGGGTVSVDKWKQDKPYIYMKIPGVTIEKVVVLKDTDELPDDPEFPVRLLYIEEKGLVGPDDLVVP